MKTTIDTHAHVLKKSYGDELNDIINKMKDEDTVAYNISYDINSSKEVLELHETHEHLIPVIGVHPVDAKGWNESILNEIESLITDNVAAIGEIGLDYYHEPFDKDEQARAFIDQIELSIKYNLPVVVHTRDSLDDAYEIIKNYPQVKFLVHSWSGDLELTKKFMEISNNIYFSFNGILTFKNATMQQEVIKIIPIDRLMFETDCPYLSPTPYRGKTNYPWRTKQVIEFAAELLNIDVVKLNDINNVNAKEFYKK